jgi:ferric-dicitrate binding protein FerR (iron transport regulator)
MAIDISKREWDRRRNRRWLLIQASAAAALAFAPIGAIGAERAGSVEDVKGEAFAEAARLRRALGRASPLFVGDDVATGAESRLNMLLGRDTNVRLGENARLTIDRFLVNAGGDMTLESGPLLFDRPAGARPVPMQIRSPFALIAVRGTRFFAGPSNGRFGIFVARGSVSVAAAGQRVVLREGEGTDFAFPGDQPTPVTRWKPPRIRASLASVS